MMNKILYLIIGCMFFTSCQKYEGEGGSSSIVGNIKKIRYFKDFSVLYDTVPAVAYDVYIVYGDNDFYNDDIETHYDGSFRFDYLHKGTYTIYIYSENLNQQTDTVIKVDIEITENNKVVSVPDLFVNDEISGNSTISGRITAIDMFDAEMNIKPGYSTIPYNVIDEDVFIIYENNKVYFNDTKTDYQGNYIFTELIPGTYYIYVYSKYIDLVSFEIHEQYPFFDTVIVNSLDENVNGKTLTIYD